MKLIFAPLHGVTSAHYRNLHASVFGRLDAYGAPFIATSDFSQANPVLFRDIDPVSNTKDIHVLPQLLSSDGKQFKDFATYIAAMGYTVIDWNIGCPFPSVTRKHKGSRLLESPDKIQAFLDTACSTNAYKISVKMRLGYRSVQEGLETMAILNQYPLAGVTIHARAGVQKYEGTVDLNGFDALYAHCRHEVTYNGDILSPSDFRRIQRRYPDIQKFMLGRGLLKDPLLAERIRGRTVTHQDYQLKIRAFHDGIFSHHASSTKNERQLYAQMKGFWSYLHETIDPHGRYIGKIQRSTSAADYHKSVNALLNAPYAP